MTRLDKWDIRFIELAAFISKWSKDPSTKCGCVIADSKHRIVSLGFNGLPRTVEDSDSILTDRAKKLKLIIHAEENALLFATRSLHSCSAYVWPMQPCSRCAGKLIQAGIRRVVAKKAIGDIASRWSDDHALAEEMYRSAGVVVDIE